MSNTEIGFKNWGTHSPVSQPQKPMDEEEFRRRWNKMEEWNRQLERHQQAKAAFKLSINEAIVYPVCMFIYRIIDWFKKK